MRGCQAAPAIGPAANLAGQNPDDLARPLAGFRGGSRKSDTMTPLAAKVTDTRIADVAAYYGHIEIAVTKVPGQ